MKNEFWYVINLNPVPWRVGPAGVARGSGGKMRAYVGRDQELRNYQDAVKAELQKQVQRAPMEGPFKMTIYFWRQIEQYATERAAKAMSNEADGTNLYKATEDACQGILFSNDRNNIDGHFVMVEQNTRTTGRIVIRVQLPTGDEEAEMLKAMPDEVYASVYGRSGEQLEIALNEPNTELARENDKYAKSGDDF